MADLAALGLTLEEIARTLGIAPSTLYLRRRDFSEFSEAVKVGRARGIQTAANEVFNTITDPNASRQVRLAAAMFYLKTRAGWREQDAAQVEVTIFGEAAASATAEDEARERRRAMLSQLTIDERRQLRDPSPPPSAALPARSLAPTPSTSSPRPSRTKPREPPPVATAKARRNLRYDAAVTHLKARAGRDRRRAMLSNLTVEERRQTARAARPRRAPHGTARRSRSRATWSRSRTVTTAKIET